MFDAEQEIRALLRERDEAIAAGDAERVVAHVETGAVSFDLPPPLQYVHAAGPAIAGLSDWFRTWDGAVTSEMANPEVIVNGDLAVAYGLSRMRGDKKGSGPTDMWFRSTVVLIRREGRWRIVHTHDSVPMKMDGSGAAATDLKPD